MKSTRLLLALTAANMVLLVSLLMQGFAPAQAQGGSTVIRGRALELVDEQGRVRASLGVMPAGTSPGGAAYPETVLLRLITERGRPSVKLSASEQASGLSFAGPTGTRETYVILESRETASMLKVRNEDGREQIVKP
jgi:hypothetical protein